MGRIMAHACNVPVAGIITKVAIKCAPLLPCKATSFMAVPSFAAVQRAHALACKHFPLSLSAFEFLDAASVQLAVHKIEEAEQPFQEQYPMYIMIELVGVHSARYALVAFCISRQVCYAK
jgi:FAD/FMN-containing dehydrogenase